VPTNRQGALKASLAAIYGLLNVSSLLTLAPGGVHHGEASPNETRDYLVLQAPTAERWDAMRSPGERQFVQLSAVTFKPGYGQALEIIEEAQRLVDGERPTIAGHLCVQLRWVDTVSFRDPELVAGRTSHRAVATFELLVDQV
jgi:hypothetical protein